MVDVMCSMLKSVKTWRVCRAVGDSLCKKFSDDPLIMQCNDTSLRLMGLIAPGHDVVAA